VEPSALAEARTGVDGHFALADLAPGAWALTVRAEGQATAFRPAVDPATVREPLRLELRLGATVTGRIAVLGAGPRPAAVVAISGMGDVRGEVAADGTYRLGPLAPGPWLVVPTGPDTTLHPHTDADREELRTRLGAAEVEATHGATPHLDLSMPALPSLDVRLDGWPAGTTLDRVDAMRADPRTPRGRLSVGFGPATFRGRPADGGVVLPAVLPGRYALEVWVTTTSSGGRPGVVQQMLIVSGIDVPNEPRAQRIDVPAPR
jgi:hypothetical protein